jgi:hypothetical protein
MIVEVTRYAVACDQPDCHFTTDDAESEQFAKEIAKESGFVVAVVDGAKCWYCSSHDSGKKRARALKRANKR